MARTFHNPCCFWHLKEISPPPPLKTQDYTCSQSHIYLSVKYVYTFSIESTLLSLWKQKSHHFSSFCYKHGYVHRVERLNLKHTTIRYHALFSRNNHVYLSLTLSSTWQLSPEWYCHLLKGRFCSKYTITKRHHSVANRKAPFFGQ